MKTILILLIFLSYTTGSVGQTEQKKFSYSAEYSPSFSNLTSTFRFTDNRFRLSHNAFLKVDYRLFNKVYLTTGIGLLSTREYVDINLSGFEGFERIESLRSHNFLMIPVGLKFQFGSFFINPEIAFGINISRPTRQINYLTDGGILTSHHNLTEDFWGYQKISIPLMLTLGYEIPIGNLKLLIGAKGYYSLTPLKEESFFPSHPYGFGIMTGLKF